MLKEVVPGLSRVGVLRNLGGPLADTAFKEYETLAPTLKIRLQSLGVRGPNPDLEGQINDELVDLFNWLKQRGDLETASRLAPIVDSLTRMLIQIAEKKLQP